MSRIYLDHAASTPLDPQVLAAMRPWLESSHGNPSSLHAEGRRAKEALDRAREITAEKFGCLFGEIVFTSGGTEAAVLAIVGAVLGHSGKRRRVLYGSSEHHCVLGCEDILCQLGFSFEAVPVDQFGRLDLEALSTTLSDDVLLVSAMHANNELGTFNDIFQIRKLTASVGSLLFVDAVQTFPALDVSGLGADMISCSSHKFGGPKASGALFVRSGTKLKPVTAGGGQEREVRAGTENVAGIVGLGEAIQAFKPVQSDTRDLLKCEIQDRIEGVEFTAGKEPVLPGHLHMRFPGIPADSLLVRLDRMGVSASSGAACSSGSLEPSHVLMACGYSLKEAGEGIRFTLGRSNTAKEGVRAAEILADAVAQIRAGQAAG